MSDTITAACFPSSASNIDHYGRPCCRSSTVNNTVAMLRCLWSASRAEGLVVWTYACNPSRSFAAMHESESGTQCEWRSGISPRQLCGEQETSPRTGATWFRQLYVPTTDMRAPLTEARVKSLPQMRVVVPRKHVPLIRGLARIVRSKTNHRNAGVSSNERVLQFV